jgi:hypothetical protein
LGNTIDAQMIEVSAASGYGSWHNFATQMNDNDHVVYIAKDSSNIWTATFYDANGLELAVVNTGITSQSERILVTSDGDFVLGGSGYREVYSQDGILLGNSSLGGSIRLDGYDVVYLRSSSEVIEYDPFSLY